MESALDINNPLLNSYLCERLMNFLEFTDALSVLVLAELNKKIGQTVFQVLKRKGNRASLLKLCQAQGGPTSCGISLFQWSRQAFGHLPQFSKDTWNLEVSFDKNDLNLIKYLAETEPETTKELVKGLIKNDRSDVLSEVPLELISFEFMRSAFESFAVKIVKCLVAKGASINVFKALDLCDKAEQAGKLEMVEFLISRGFRKGSAHGSFAAKTNNIGHLQFLEDNGAPFIHNGVFRCAAQAGNMEVIKFCVDHIVAKGEDRIYTFLMLVETVTALQPEMVDWIIRNGNYEDMNSLRHMAIQTFQRQRDNQHLLPLDWKDRQERILASMQ